MRSPGKRYRHLKRYQEIARALIRHGFGGLVDQLGLLPALSLPRRLLHREAEVTPLSPPEHLRLAIEELGPPSSNWASLIVGMALLIPLVAGEVRGLSSGWWWRASPLPASWAWACCIPSGERSAVGGEPVGR